MFWMNNKTIIIELGFHNMYVKNLHYEESVIWYKTQNFTIIVFKKPH